MGAVTGSPPRIEAQVGKLHLPVLLDSGSARSLITFHQFQQLNLGGPELKLLPTELSCVTASGQNLEIVGEEKLTQNSGIFMVLDLSCQ